MNDSENSTGQESQNHLEDIYEETSMEGYDKQVKRAKYTLFILAALQLLPLFLMGNLPDSAKYVLMAMNIGISLMFAGLALWTNKKPYWAIITALVVYTLLVIVNAMLDPSTLFQGLILKFVFYFLLISALGNARDVQQWLDSKPK